MRHGEPFFIHVDISVPPVACLIHICDVNIAFKISFSLFGWCRSDRRNVFEGAHIVDLVQVFI